MKATLYTDGGVRTGGVNGPTGGKHGPGAIGYVVRDESNKIIERGGQFLEDTTVNEAEYSAIICGLAACKRLGVTALTVRADSQLVVMQLNGVWAVKAAHLHDYHQEVLAQSMSFEPFEIGWIPREQNSAADEITRQIMTENGVGK